MSGVMLEFFFFNDTATTEIYTLSLHDALPILVMTDCLALFDHIDPPARPPPRDGGECLAPRVVDVGPELQAHGRSDVHPPRSEEHTSELQSQSNLVCRLLLEQKKHTINST